MRGFLTHGRRRERVFAWVRPFRKGFWFCSPCPCSATGLTCCATSARTIIASCTAAAIAVAMVAATSCAASDAPSSTAASTLTGAGNASQVATSAKAATAGDATHFDELCRGLQDVQAACSVLRKAGMRPLHNLQHVHSGMQCLDRAAVGDALPSHQCASIRRECHLGRSFPKSFNRCLNPAHADSQCCAHVWQASRSTFWVRSQVSFDDERARLRVRVTADGERSSVARMIRHARRPLQFRRQPRTRRPSLTLQWRGAPLSYGELTPKVVARQEVLLLWWNAILLRHVHVWHMEPHCRVCSATCQLACRRAGGRASAH
jgi:hypothetical protein